MTMVDPKTRVAKNLGQRNYADVQSVTPSDTVDLEYPCDGIFATVAGNICIITAAWTTITIPIGAGAILALQIKRVKALASGTTATGLLAFYY